MLSTSKGIRKTVGKVVKSTLSVPFINPNLNPAKYSGLFQTLGIVSIPNFLDAKFVEKYYNFLEKEMNEEWWYLSGFCQDEKKIIENTAENQDKILEVKKLANQDFVDNKFSYVFYRTYNNHWSDCDCPECNFRSTVNSPEFLIMINKITGMNLQKNNELFVSRYGENCFLTVHNDNGNGKIAFVINMTKDWLPQFGGNFCLLKHNRKQIRKLVSPQFNSLTIFKIPQPDGIPHYVSHVISGVKQYRYAISGWFS